MNQITISSFNKSDIQEVMTLDELSLGGLWGQAQYERELSLPNSNFSLLCLSKGDSTPREIIGMGCWRVIAKDVEIPLFVIHPNYQAQGFGSYFFGYLLLEMVKRNLRQARLDVNVNNPKAIALYKKFGFQVLAKMEKFYRRQQEDAYKMMLPSMKDKYFRSQLTANYQSACQLVESRGFELTSVAE